MSSLQVLVIDDEPAIRQVLAAYLGRAGYVVDQAASGTEALERLAKGDVDVALCDIRMPDMTGIEVVRRAREQGLDTQFLMMTAYASVSTAIEAMRAGAYDYMIKPLRNEDVLHRLGQIADVLRLRAENRALRSLVVGEAGDRCRMESPPMRQLERMVAKVAPTDSTVLITGESGTGKGVIAKEIHRLSRRAEQPFIPVNCGAIPETLIESELFGHTKGAFTGADRAKKGLFLEADRGTIFLDEVGELPLPMQVKLLHVLEEKKVRPVGSETARPVDVRIIAATNRDLAAMVAEGTFREDLYFRLNVFQIQVPPLREHREDVPRLVEHFLRRHGHGESWRLDPEAEAMLMAHDWPGNVRELENVIQRALILAEDGVITVADLPAQFARPSTPRAQGARTLREQVREFEAGVILRAIEEAGGDRREAARRLGIGLSTLYRKLEEYERAGYAS
ncbi:sigma-54-dependent transcriptional regulator [Inmirania thermothiophila]|uniref:Two component Fis family sigma54 specific transcriptional regulator n=1 Tax=Inmirania thermothiophila TaxID=1750597 RepID=A0A3N1Y272_9GAMM|nr:sigma-54 dependent transcriptional regulator [Inmirania thermothiophila]ROR32906.1 two component Fis family sigma54 specific transcriptional regulator [Inmirania thermothiophila]